MSDLELTLTDTYFRVLGLIKQVQAKLCLTSRQAALIAIASSCAGIYSLSSYKLACCGVFALSLDFAKTKLENLISVKELDGQTD